MLATGTLIDGFRVERVIGRGSTGVVYEATQLSLDRRLALRVLHPGLGEGAAFLERFRRESRLQAALDDPHVVAVHEAGESEHGLFVAMRLVRGSSLAALLQEGSLDTDRALRLLRQVAEALDAAHASGLVHGSVNARNVLVEPSGRAYLGDFGLTAGKEAAPESDRCAFAALLSECLAALPGPVEPTESATAMLGAAERALRRRRHAAMAFAAAIVAAMASAVAVLALARDGAAPTPSVLAGAVALGSNLAAGDLRSVDCNGRAASGSSPDCTALQTRLPGRPLRVTRSGAVRRWAVRGARGELALQVVRGRGGRYVQVTRSQLEVVPDEDVHSFATDLEIEPGDAVAVLVTPGASIGVRSSRGAATSRWFAALRGSINRPPTRGAGTGFAFEILLRVEYVPGARRRFPRQLTGAQAAAASRGRELGSKFVELSESMVVRVALVQLPDRLVLDLFQGSRRAARIDVPGAESDGELVRLAPVAVVAPPSALSVDWRNPDGRLVSHWYAVRASSFRLIY